MEQKPRRNLLYRRPLPEYYPTMYMDGYEPWEIMEAARKSMLDRYHKRKQEQEIPNVKIVSEVKIK